MKGYIAHTLSRWACLLIPFEKLGKKILFQFEKLDKKRYFDIFEHFHVFNCLVTEETRDLCVHDLCGQEQVLTCDGEWQSEGAIGLLSFAFTKFDVSCGRGESDQLSDVITHGLQRVVYPNLS